MSHACCRNEAKHPLYERDTSAQHWHKHQLLASELGRLHGGERRLNGDLRKRKVPRDLITQKHADLLKELAKRFRRGRLVANQGQLVLNKRMIDNRDAFHESTSILLLKTLKTLSRR